MTYSAKIVLVSTSGYVPERDDPFLRELLAARVQLFCATGIDANQWEDALDWLYVDLDIDMDEYLLVTTAHRDDESLADVIEFAESCDTSAHCTPQLIYR